MRITGIETELLHVPLSRPRASPTEAAAGRLNHVNVLLVHVDTDAGLRGLGFAYALQGSGRALYAVAADDARGRDSGTCSNSVSIPVIRIGASTLLNSAAGRA